jgi:hypothetical protein
MRDKTIKELQEELEAQKESNDRHYVKMEGMLMDIGYMLDIYQARKK